MKIIAKGIGDFLFYKFAVKIKETKYMSLNTICSESDFAKGEGWTCTHLN